LHDLRKRTGHKIPQKILSPAQTKNGQSTCGWKTRQPHQTSRTKVNSRRYSLRWVAHGGSLFSRSTLRTAPIEHLDDHEIVGHRPLQRLQCQLPHMRRAAFIHLIRIDNYHDCIKITCTRKPPHSRPPTSAISATRGQITPCHAAALGQSTHMSHALFE